MAGGNRFRQFCTYKLNLSVLLSMFDSVFLPQMLNPTEAFAETMVENEYVPSRLSFL